MENSPPGIHTIAVEPAGGGPFACEAFSAVARNGGITGAESSGALAEVPGGELPTVS
jgi:hypothetical protein